MPLYALNEGHWQHISEALKGGRYRCPECDCPFIVKKGVKTAPHFAHKKTMRNCRLFSRGENHMLAKKFLESLFADKNPILERPFPSIRRIADICIESEKLIFEVQCSAIPKSQAKKRMRDYSSIGYRLLWILDDARYNKRILRPEEETLREHGALFLSVKKGILYEQREILRGKRREKLERAHFLNPDKILRFSPPTLNRDKGYKTKLKGLLWSIFAIFR